MNFELVSKEGTKPTPVYYNVRKNRKGHRIHLKYYPGILVCHDEWNERLQRVRELDGIPYESYNDTLETIERTVKDVFKRNDYFKITKEKLKEEIDFALKRKTKKGDSFFTFLDDFIDYTKTKRGTRASMKMGTMKKKLPNDTDWFSFDYNYYLQLILSLEKDDKSKNYIGTIIKDLKIALNYAYKIGKIKHKTWGDWVAPSEKVYNIYLTEDELIRLYDLKDLKPYQEKARDLFLIGCYTGMRAENYLNIDPELNINLKKKQIKVVVNKNGPRVTIPIHWLVQEIIEKYNGLPESISQQKLNKYIKEVAQHKDAKLKDKVIVAKTIGGKREVIVKEKWEMITTHTARRTLAANMYKNDVPLRYIMKITGHKTESQCLHYIKDVWDEDEEEIASMDFWRK